MKVISREHITHVLSKENLPCETIRSGEIAVFETYDCFTNRFIPEQTTIIPRNFQEIRLPVLFMWKGRGRETC